MIGIVDYNAGNITSVERALKSLGTDFILSKKPADLKDCDRLIFPGVGDAAYAMVQLKETGFDDFLRKSVEEGKPLLGICLGSQIIFQHSEEGDTECLGLIKGNIRHFESLDKDIVSKGFKIPHMGWNNLNLQNGDCPILKGIPEKADFYFVHSYVICPESDSVIKASADYGVKVPAVIQSGNIFACQFHPEKSGAVGLSILKNFGELKC
ncbi:MAG: imidazole glycerol phosphate synthase subunit HisH [Treponema sp.]|nr:imidazole glycerol phosphate synthase subunit HisH [Treponema sp.]